jgi:O-antigen/teichoic acid export membrane protein
LHGQCGQIHGWQCRAAGYRNVLTQELLLASNNTDQGMAARLRRVWAYSARSRHLQWAMSDQGMVSAINFLTGLLLARFLGPAEFGRFTLAWMSVEFLLSAQQSLIVLPMMSFAPKKELNQRPVYFGSVVSCQAVFSTVSLTLFIFAVFGINAVKPEWGLEVLIIPLVIVALMAQLQNFTRRYLFTCNRGLAATIVDLVRYGGQIAILLPLLMVTQMDAADCLWIIAITSATSALIGSFMLERLRWNADVFRQTAHQHWEFAKWLLSSELCRWASSNLFVVVAGILLGAAAVGVIRAAQNLVGLCHILSLGLENVIPAQAARKFAVEGEPALVHLLQRVAIFGSLAIGGIGVVAVVAPEFWLHLFYGSNYAGHGYLVLWSAAAYFVGFFKLPPQYGLRAIEKTKGIFIAQLAAAVFTAFAVYPLIKNFGITGVMAGNLVVAAIQVAVLLRIFFQHVPYDRVAVRASGGQSNV